MSTKTRSPKSESESPPGTPRRIRFIRQMFEGAAHRASVAKTHFEIVFSLGQAWAWAEAAEEEVEDPALYRRRLASIVVRLNELGMKPLPAELPGQLGTMHVPASPSK